MPEAPSEEEVLSYFDKLSNWGRWGDDDSLGTLNLITPDVRKRAAATVQTGRSVSCAWDIQFNAGAPYGVGPQRFMLQTGQGLNEGPAPEDHAGMGHRSHAASEFFGMAFHGLDHTHLDAPSHFFWDAKMYNGKDAHTVNSTGGATQHAVTEVRDGIVTRGVLLDVAAVKGVDWMGPGDGVFPEDLEEAEARQGVTVDEGTAILLRTGNGRKRREGEPGPLLGQPGFQAACLPWLYDRGVAMLAADVAADALPSGYVEVGAPVHAVGMVAMGLWLIDNCDLEGLTAACQELGRWEFLFTVGPLRLTGGTGSPVNPIAVL